MNKKCPRCTYPLVNIGKIEICENCFLLIHEKTIYTKDFRGKAKEVYISFALEKDTLILVIEDDGIGCEEIKQGFGLHHMEERVKLLNGTLRVYGYDGFMIIAEIPLRREI